MSDRDDNIIYTNNENGWSVAKVSDDLFVVCVNGLSGVTVGSLDKAQHIADNMLSGKPLFEYLQGRG